MQEGQGRWADLNSNGPGQPGALSSSCAPGLPPCQVSTIRQPTCYGQHLHNALPCAWYPVPCCAMLCCAVQHCAVLTLGYLPQHTVLQHAMLCYAMLCYAMLCYAMLCLCCAVLCYAMLRYARVPTHPQKVASKSGNVGYSIWVHRLFMFVMCHETLW